MVLHTNIQISVLLSFKLIRSINAVSSIELHSRHILMIDRRQEKQHCVNCTAWTH